MQATSIAISGVCLGCLLALFDPDPVLFVSVGPSIAYSCLLASAILEELGYGDGSSEWFVCDVSRRLRLACST